MDTPDLIPLVNDLSSNLDDLEESLAPLLKSALSQSTSKLPLLDKAKLYVLVTYAIESILFSYLRLNGVEAKSHPVFQELTRVKQYFGKIKAAETAGTKRNTTLDREAANRFIKHGLAGNEKYDRERQERLAREKTGAKRKLKEMQVGTHTRFDSAAKRMRASEGWNSTVVSGDERVSGQDGTGGSAATTDAEIDQASPVRKRSKAEKQAAKRQRRLERRLAEGSASKDGEGAEEGTSPPLSGEGDDDTEDTQTSPTTTTEALEALLSTSVPDEEGRTPKKKKKKRRSKHQKLEDERADEMK